MDIQNETSNSNESNIHVNNETTRSDPNVFLTEPNIQVNLDYLFIRWKKRLK